MGERRRRRTHVRAVEGRADAAQRVDVSGFFGVRNFLFVQTKPPSRAGSDSVGLPDSTRSACRTLRNQGDNPSLARCEFIVLQVLQAVALYIR